MEVRAAKGGWRAEVVWRSPNGGILVVHALPPVPYEPGTGYTAVWHNAAGVAQHLRPRSVDQNFDLLPTTCPTCGRE